MNIHYLYSENEIINDEFSLEEIANYQDKINQARDNINKGFDYKETTISKDKLFGIFDDTYIQNNKGVLEHNLDMGVLGAAHKVFNPNGTNEYSSSGGVPILNWGTIIGTNALKVLDLNSIEHQHEAGISNIPYDNYPAILHKNERVLNAVENQEYSQGTAIARMALKSFIVNSAEHPLYVTFDQSKIERIVQILENQYGSNIIPQEETLQQEIDNTTTVVSNDISMYV